MRTWNEMEFCKPLRVVVVFCTIFHLHRVTGIIPKHSVTLLDKDHSYVEYEQWNSTSMKQLSFSFKTFCSSCFLLYLDNKTGKRETDNYLLLTLVDGQLNVGIHRKSSTNYLKNTFAIANDLSDIAWHKVEITISKRGSFISVENEKRTLIEDDAFLLSSRLFFGGIESDAAISAAVNRPKINYLQRFVGCIGSVTFVLKNSTRKRGKEIRKSKTSSGCLDNCRDDSCKNGGRCYNWLNQTACDCVGTGFQGATCTSATEVVFLNQSEFIGISTSLWKQPTTFKLRFRTIHSDGLLIGTRRKARGFYVAIKQGYLNVFLQPRKVLLLGDGYLHDGQWHFLQIKLSEFAVDVSLDRTISKSFQSDEQLQILEFPIYIGSIPKDTKQDKSSPEIQSFVGCVQDIYLNKMEVVNKMLYTADSTLSYSKTILKNCPMKQESKTEARKRINARKQQKAPSKPPTKQGDAKMKNGKRVDQKAGKQEEKGPSSEEKLAAANNKDLIAWITSGVVSGTIVLMIMTACAIHYFKFKYENIFVARMHEQENMQEQQANLSSMQMFPKQQAVVFLPEKQVTKVVNL